jgi:hypothetical protein
MRTIRDDGMAIALKNYNITTSFKIQAVVVDARSII